MSIDDIASGVYIRKGSKTKDLVYETTKNEFVSWLEEQGLVVKINAEEIPILDRYNILREMEKAGCRFAKINSEWNAFAENMEKADKRLNTSKYN